jgi:proteic killer suppression protein
MIIRSIRHKGLKKFIVHGDERLIPMPSRERLRNMISYLQDIEDVTELKHIPSWSAHLLTGDRKGM